MLLNTKKLIFNYNAQNTLLIVLTNMSKPNNNNNKKKTQWRVKSDQKEPNIDIVNLADKIDLLVNKVQSLEKEIKKLQNSLYFKGYRLNLSKIDKKTFRKE